MNSFSLTGRSLVRSITVWLTALTLLPALVACEDPIKIKLDTGPSQLAVDAWLTNDTTTQVVRLTRTTGYFDASLPPAATGATVTVTDDRGAVYSFVDAKSDGNYQWKSATGDTFGRIGRTYTLAIQYEGQQYQALSEMRRVTPIDSLIFRKEKLNPVSTEEGYQAEFYATDIPNGTDYYWIRAYRNGERLNGISDITVSYDGSFNASGGTDGLAFIQPLRRSVNPDSLYDLNDVVKVELLSITPDAFSFFQQLSTQVNNGGLFATPPANVPTNVMNVNPKGPQAVGYFGVSAISSRTATVSPTNIRESQ